MATLTPRRSTISTFGNMPGRLNITKPGQCTHLTMTRLYTSDFQCQVCFCNGSMGWLYRCTQDRELLIEDDMERGIEEKPDALCDVLPRSTGPKKRSAEARKGKLSFLEEITDAQLRTYSTTQLTEILNQRAHLLDMLTESVVGSFQGDKSCPNPAADNNASPSGSPNIPQNKPWMPLKECQFKCCHRCRPSLGDRSYLSLNGIMNGDIPATATTGFGFHLNYKRPVAPVKVVKNIGLRPSPPPRPIDPNTPTYRLSRHRRFYMLPHPPPAGLGLLIPTAEAIPERTIASSSTRFLVITTPPPLHSLEPDNQAFQNIQKTPLQLQPHPTLPPPPSPEATLSSLMAELASLTPLPPLTPSEQVSLEENSAQAEPLTPMEEDEADKGIFGPLPLSVKGGVAFTEESVECHVPDLEIVDPSTITQF